MLLRFQASQSLVSEYPLSNIHNKLETEWQYSHDKKKKKNEHYKTHLTKVKGKPQNGRSYLQPV